MRTTTRKIWLRGTPWTQPQPSKFTKIWPKNKTVQSSRVFLNSKRTINTNSKQNLLPTILRQPVLLLSLVSRISLENQVQKKRKLYSNLSLALITLLTSRLSLLEASHLSFLRPSLSFLPTTSHLMIKILSTQHLPMKKKSQRMPPLKLMSKKMYCQALTLNLRRSSRSKLRD